MARIKGLIGAVPEIPTPGQAGAVGPAALGTLGPGGLPQQATGSPGGPAKAGASQQAFAKRIMGMAPDRFAKLMQKLGAGPIV